MTSKVPVITARAYSVVATDDVTETAVATPVVLATSSRRPPLALDRPVHTVPHEFQHIPEAVSLTWTDDFFDDDDGIVAVFDFDYDTMEAYYTKSGWACIAATLLYTPLFVAQLVLLVPCFLQQNVQWTVRAQHVAITRDGIRFVRDKRQCCWGQPCTDQGKTSKTVPFDKITDCDIEEPAGNSCFCIRNVLSTVNIDTASSGPSQRELQIAGLKDPHSFKKLVWAMKRAYGSGPTTVFPHHVPHALEMMDRKTDATSGAASAGANNDVSLLLREIRDELRQHNALLQTMQPTTATTTATTASLPSAPPSERTIV